MHCEHHMASAGHVADFGSCVQYSFNNNQIGYLILAILAQYCSLAVLNFELKFDEKLCANLLYIRATQVFTFQAPNISYVEETHIL